VLKKERGLSWFLAMKNAQVVRPLTYMTGMVNQQVHLQNEYLAAENATLRDYLPGKWRHLVWQWRSSLNQAAIVVITARLIRN